MWSGVRRDPLRGLIQLPSHVVAENLNKNLLDCPMRRLNQNPKVDLAENLVVSQIKSLQSFSGKVLGHKGFWTTFAVRAKIPDDEFLRRTRQLFAI